MFINAYIQLFDEMDSRPGHAKTFSDTPFKWYKYIAFS